MPTPRPPSWKPERGKSGFGRTRRRSNHVYDEGKWDAVEAKLGRRVGEEEVTAMAQAMVEKGDEAGGGQRPAGLGGLPRGEPGDDPGGDDGLGGKPAVVRGAGDKVELTLAQAFAGGRFG